MGEAFIIRRGGISSDGSLDLKIIGGTTQPTGTENTVWVNTDTEISGWAFSTTEPESPVEGMVWFKTSANSSAPMNVDKKNTVMVYPNSCMQYVGDAWVVKEAKTYQNGEWNNWELTIVPNLTEYASDKWTKSNATVSTTAENTTVASINSGHCYAFVPIDVSSYSVMYLNGTASRTSGGNSESYSYLGLFTDTGISVSSFSVGFSCTHSGNSNHTINQSYDISALTGVYYLAYRFQATSNPSSTSTWKGKCVATSIKFT